MSGLKEFDVIVVGELNIDIILNDIESFPKIGAEVIANEMTQTLGSSAAIFANNLSVLGSKVAFLGKIGLDGFSAQVTSSLKKSGVDVSYIIKTPYYLTGLTVAFNYENDRAMVTYPGAMKDLTIADVKEEVLRKASHLHVSSVFLQDGLKPNIVELFKKAKSLNLTTSLDPQWDPKEKWDINLKELLPYVDVFLPNTEELQRLTGKNDLDSALEHIKTFCNIVVVKNGVEGAVMWDKGLKIKQKAFLNVDVKDAIGAGDSFNSGFITKFTKKKPLKECLEFGALTGAVNTTSSGGTGAFESYDKVKAIADEKFSYKLREC